MHVVDELVQHRAQDEVIRQERTTAATFSQPQFDLLCSSAATSNVESL